METDLLQYLPDWFQKIRDFEQLATTEGEQMESVAAAMDAIRQNFHLGCADAGTVGDWENFLYITPNLAVEPLEFRRTRIINRLSSTPPFSLRFLYDRLDLLIGKNKWTVTVDYPGYTIYVEAAAENQIWAEEVLITINTIKPCHIVYVNKPLLASEILLAEEVGLHEGEYRYRLGAWALGRDPFLRYNDRGVIVTKEQHSIEPGLLSDVAAFAAMDIASVRLNGEIGITNFDVKEAAGGRATVQYTVSHAQAATVTKVELLSATGAVLTSTPVYVPVTASVQFKHTITTKEGS